MIYERIKELCKKNGISVSELEKRVGVSRGSICKIDKHAPSSNTVDKIARELHTSFDYIIIGKEGPYKDEPMVIEVEMLDAYHKLNQEQRMCIYNLMISMLGNKEE